EAARSHLQQAMVLCDAVAAAEPDNRLAHGELATAHSRLGLVNQRLVNLPEALRYTTKGVELREQLMAADPKDAAARRPLLRHYTYLSEVHAALVDLAAVRQDLLKALRLAQKLADDRDDLLAQADLAETYFDLGTNEIEARDYEEAAKWIQQGVTILQEF